jgi:hypothetical protein
MESAVTTFVRFWSELPLSGPQHVHPADTPYVRAGKFELSLLPIPVNGSLANAEAIVLTLNPGLRDEDRAWEDREDFRNSLLNNLRQTHSGSAYPLNYLDPAFAMHAGAGYWSQSRRLRGERDLQKLHHITKAIAQRDGVSTEMARGYVARKVAILQLCPYHSAAKPSANVLRALPSSNAAREFVKGLIAEKSKLVVATRSVMEWGFSGPVNTEHLVVYDGNQGTSASLTMKSLGGQAIYRCISRVQLDDGCPPSA